MTLKKIIAINSILILIIFAFFEIAFEKIFDSQSGSLKDINSLINSAKENHKTLSRYTYEKGYTAFTGWGEGFKTLGGSKKEHLIFIGDSVTNGWGVPGNGFVDILSRDIKDKSIINAGINGSGIDQMYIRVVTELISTKPNKIIISFIPHDILRAGTDYIFGSTKPKFLFSKSERFLKLAQNNQEYIDNYEHYKKNHLISLWYIRKYWENRHYFYPEYYEKYYDTLLNFISKDLHGLAQAKKIQIILVRLPNTYEFKGLEMVDETLMRFKDKLEQDNFFKYYDLTKCSKEKSIKYKINFQKEFNFHPNKTGHKIISECLRENVIN